MSERGLLSFLRDIREAAGRITAYTRGLSYNEFRRDHKTQDAVIRNLEIIGEAVKNISDTDRAGAPDVPWKSMAGMRDRLIHAYFGVNLDIVWAVATEELPAIMPEIERMIRGLE